MKKFTYNFRSIMVNNVEKVIPNTVFSKMVIEMDESSVMKHTLVLSLKDIMFDPALILNFFLSLIIIAPITALFIGGAYLAAGKGPSWYIIKIIILLGGMVAFLIIWIFLSVKQSIANKKRKHVIAKRGAGNWKLVDESKWSNFQRLLDIARNQREKEKLIK